MDNGTVLLSESSSWMDVLEVLASGMTGCGGRGGGTLLDIVIGAHDISPDGDDIVRSWHFQNQVGIVRNFHELGECRPSQEGVVCYLKVNYLKLQVFSSPEGYRKSDLTYEGCCYTRDYAME
jgi:hypothetical protein